MPERVRTAVAEARLGVRWGYKEARFPRDTAGRTRNTRE